MPPDILLGVHPLLQSKIAAVLDAMNALGHPMRVCQGCRTLEQQQALYAQGRTAPGAIVTQADGLRVRSNHQGGRAVDCCFLGPEPFAESHPWAEYGALAQSHGLIWGGGHTAGWHGQDRPHVQLPTTP